MKPYKSIIILIVLLAISCDSNTKKIATSKIMNPEYNFGEITMTESISHTFYLKNVSDTPLKITKVGTSCGCTTTNYSQDEIGKNETASIEVLFIPEQIGLIDKSIVVEANTDPPFNVFYIKGDVK